LIIRRHHDGQLFAAARPTILVVDDETPIRELVRRVLEVAGYEVTQAASGLEAIEMLSAGAPLDAARLRRQRGSLRYTHHHDRGAWRG
jgi:PleD family two-component response regulator